jgi:hypothetical protein
MSVDDFDMSNGGTGLLDLYDLPLFAASQLELIPNATGLAIGGSLRLSLRVPPKPFVRARGSLGSYGYGLTDIVVGTGELGTSRALLAAQLASSRGNYLFANSSSDPQIMPLRRQNNDQTRSFALIKTQHGFSSADLEFFAFVRQHQGGLAGPATFPTPSLRIFSQKALFGTSLSWQIASYPMTLRWESRFDRNETHESELSNFDRTLFMVNSLNLKGEKRFELADTYCSLDTKLWSSQLLDGGYHRLSALFEVAVNTAPFDFWSMRFRRSFSLQLHSDVGWFLVSRAWSSLTFRSA